MRTTLLRLLAVLAAVSLFAAACGSDDDNGDTAEPGDTPTDTSGDGDQAAGEGCEETVPGTQINYGVFAPTTSLDPPYVSGALVGGTELAAVYDVLFEFDLETSEYEPKLAESLEPNDDFTEWTLTLREGITYSDGTELTAQLVSDNIDRFFADDVRNTSGGFLTPIEEKTVVDDLTLEITLSSPWPEFPFVFADEPGMIVNTNAIGDDPAAFGAQPPDEAGLGPYVVERNVPGEEIVMTARDDYWGGPVCVETLRFVFIPGSGPTYEGFQNEDINVAFLRNPPVIAQAKEATDNHIFIPQDAGTVTILNHAEDRPFADPRVREAFILAADLDVLNERSYEGTLEVGKRLVGENSRFFSDAVEEFETDADRATELLDEAVADGFDGSVTILCGETPDESDTALALEGLLEAVGFDVELELIPKTDQIGEVVQGNFDAACWGFNSGPATGVTTFERNLATGSSSNRISYSNPAMDAALEALLGAQTEAELQEAMAEVNNIFVEDAVSLPVGFPEEGIVWADNVKGIDATVATIFLFDEAYIES